ncbi:hypothetical protein JTE90_022921 [Oedothorax gibbosus]|uniref:Uncharacterized protein n=1 Tax=Oedothorax gibbosus TaxID=931172 RepID=A0AAV6TGT9_9ARAC|nr:hypothetical protein JTE90_022921 [Oedothorax gibbosus]
MVHGPARKLHYLTLGCSRANRGAHREPPPRAVLLRETSPSVPISGRDDSRGHELLQRKENLFPVSP